MVRFLYEIYFFGIIRNKKYNIVYFLPIIK